LTLFEPQLIELLAQELPKGVRMVHDLLPMHRLLWCLRELLEFLRDLVQCGRHFLPATLSFVQADNLGLIGIKETLTLPLEPLAPLEQLPLLCGERGEMLLFGLRPCLVQGGNQRGRAQQVTESIPHDGIEPISADAP
jgi:hypothetical protein